MMIARTINFLLSQDPEMAHRLFQHQNKTLALELLPMRFQLYFRIMHDKVEVSKKCPEKIDTWIVGTPADFIASACTDKLSVRVSGDMEFAQTVQQVFQQFDLDIEECLSKMMGDSLAYGIGRIFRRTGEAKKEASARFGQNFKEYLEEESRWIVSKAEVENYCHEVDKMRDDVERLSQRIEMINP
jgi:ubiquinone biosynthesis protein UbiJ